MDASKQLGPFAALIVKGRLFSFELLETQLLHLQIWIVNKQINT